MPAWSFFHLGTNFIRPRLMRWDFKEGIFCFSGATDNELKFVKQNPEPANPGKMQSGSVNLGSEN